MTNKISRASHTVRAFNVGTLGDCSAWDDNLDAAPLEWLPAEEAPSFMSGTGSDEVCERAAACALLDLMPWEFAAVIRSSSKA